MVTCITDPLVTAYRHSVVQHEKISSTLWVRGGGVATGGTKIGRGRDPICAPH